jgi:ADP-heptose:LPS heptosyltransferase
MENLPGHPPSFILNPRRILVRGVNWLGDAVMTTPALLRLRECFPDALIALLTPQELHGLWLHHPAVDEIVTFKTGDSAWTVASKIKDLMWPEAKRKPSSAGPEEHPQRGAFDLAVVFPNSPRSALEMWLARVPQRVGYARPWRSFFLTLRVSERPDAVKMRKRSAGEIRSLIANSADASSIANRSRRAGPIANSPAHQIHDYLHLVAALGANPEPVPAQLVVTAGEIKAVAQKFNLGDEFTGGRPLFGMNPGAEYGPAKRWPVERFIAAAREIQKRTNCLWLIFGGKGDSEVVGRIHSGIEGPKCEARNLAGKTSLRELTALLKLSRVLLTNDTGPMHVAAALGTPVVVPFGSTSPEFTGPGLPDDPRHRLLQSDAPCSPCFLRECPIDFRCMTGISVERVVEAVMKAVEPLKC